MSARSALAIVVLLAFGSEARADKVDWSQYVEKPGTTYKNKSVKPVVDSPKPAKQTAAKSRGKAKPKPAAKARRKSH